MQPGVYPNLSNDEYHGGPGISKSGLDLIHRSPLHYRAAKTAANDNAPTAAQAIGTAFHSLLLEPDSFAQLYCQTLQRSEVPEAIDDRDQLVAMVQELNANRLPKLPTSGSKAEQIERILQDQIDRGLEADGYVPPGRDELEAMKGADLKHVLETANANRPGLLPVSGSRHELADLLRANGVPVLLWSDVVASWTEKNANRTILSDDQFQQLKAMRDAVMEHPMARALLTGRPGVAEHSVYWNDPVTGELCRCRPDFWREDDVIVDLKTTEDASPEGFAKSIANWRYDVQDPYYRDGIEIATGRKVKAFVFLAVEKKFPHAVGCYVLDPESIELGRAQCRADLDRFHECRTSQTWPGYGDKIQTISLPAWHAKKVGDQL